MTWLLDANGFITAARGAYGFDFCPAFWEWLVKANRAGSVHSLKSVLGELATGDELATWAAARPGASFSRFNRRTGRPSTGW